MTMVQSKIECIACTDTEDLMTGIRMCKVCYGKAFDVLQMDENGNPIFQTMEELSRFNEALAKYGVGKVNPPVAKTKGSTRKKSKPVVPVDAGRSTVANLDPGFIWRSTHFYTRKGDTINQTREDAKAAKALSNEANSVIFIHDHFFGLECNLHCKEI